MELIQAEDIANTEMATEKSKTKRNTYVQTWRRCKKYERRQALFVQEYVETKYRAIYDEVMEFYESVNVSYPTKHDLRKTGEFKKWKKSISGQPKKKSSSAKKTEHNSGPAASQDNSGPAASQDNSGPAASQDNTGQAASQDNSGPAASQDNTGPATSQDNSGPATSQDNSGPATSQDNSGPAATVEVLPLLPDQNLNDILQELRNDPDLNTIFNEVEIEMEENDVFW